MKLEEIKEPSELIKHLADYTQRLKGIKRVCHYTKLSSISSILKNGYWYLGNPKKMNDLFEYKKYKEVYLKQHIFFACFMAEQGESVAMWSMYAQPWEDGVRVSIPIDSFKEWISGIKEVFPVDPKTGTVINSSPIPVSNAPVSVVRVAYADISTTDAYIKCADKDNYLIGNPYVYSDLAGYIKDTAWEYEREIRLRVDWPFENSFDYLAVKIPESVLMRIEICKGPRYSGKEILTSLPKHYKSMVDISTSKFSEKIGWIPCDDCTNKNGQADSKVLPSGNGIVDAIYERGQAVPSFEKALRSDNSKELKVLGFSAEGFLHTYRKDLIRFLGKGNSIKVLLSSPKTDFTQQASEMENRPKDAIDQSIKSALSILQAIHESVEKTSTITGSIEIRFYDTEIRNQCLICTNYLGASEAWLTLLMPPLSATNCPMVKLSDPADCENYFTTIWERHKHNSITADEIGSVLSTFDSCPLKIS